jgi:hypothetical protein
VFSLVSLLFSSLLSSLYALVDSLPLVSRRLLDVLLGFYVERGKKKRG